MVLGPRNIPCLNSKDFKKNAFGISWLSSIQEYDATLKEKQTLMMFGSTEDKINVIC